MLVDLPVDLQPSGWRLTDRPGHDQNRTGAFLREDLDELAEAFDGWTGRLKLPGRRPVDPRRQHLAPARRAGGVRPRRDA